MHRHDLIRQSPLWSAVLAVLALGAPASAQDVLQLNPVAKEYTLGNYKYQAPQVDGWRQVAGLTNANTLSLVYVEQKPETESLDTRFGVAIESHQIPEGVVVEGAPALAETSRKQMSEARKADLVGISPIQAVPSIENLYTYRMLVHSPIKGDPDVYEVYYVAMSPDKKEYLVIQCIPKTADYENQLYFQQFYGSLASLKYVPPAAAGAAPAKPAPAAPEEPGHEGHGH